MYFQRQMNNDRSGVSSVSCYHFYKGSLTSSIEESIRSLSLKIFPTLDIEKFNRRISQPSLITFHATDEAKVIAFKLGFPLTDSIFYSWLGGVLPTHRQQGIGQRLMIMQHDWCKQNGYSIVRTKTMNQWRDMLILNLRNGFTITGLQPGNDGDQRIIMEKVL
jgi:GNAT superfamily N-acetyltransferase